MNTFYWIVEYMASLIEITMSCIFCGTFLNREHLMEKKYPILLYSFTGSLIIMILNHFKMFSFINSYLAIILFLIIQIRLYKPFKWTHILLVFIYTIILSAIDFSTAYFAALALNSNVPYLLNTQGSERLICILLSKTLLLLTITTFSKIFKRTFRFISKYVLMTCVYSMFLLGMIFIMLELNMHTMSKRTELLMMAFFLASVIIELAMFYFVITTTEAHELEQQMQLIELKNSMLQKSLDETEKTFRLWRRSVHDYKNDIITLTSFANKGEIDKIKAYLTDKNDIISNQTFYIKTGNSSVDAVLYTKQSYAIDNHINFIINASIPSDCFVSDIDMTNILGNLIDNAIEASMKENEPYIDITIKQEKSFFIIKIINKYSEKLPPNLATSKKDSKFHGIGLNSVRHTVHKYNGSFDIVKRDNTVVATAMMLTGYDKDVLTSDSEYY